MSADFTIREGDRLPPLEFTCEDADGPVDLSGATLTVRLKSQRTGLSVLTATATMEADQVANKGQGYYNWSDGDTSGKAGDHDAVVHVSFASGRAETFPNRGAFTVHIAPAFP